MNTLVKTGIESVEVIMCRRFAGFVARMEDTRLPKCVLFGELMGGAGCLGSRKHWICVFWMTSELSVITPTNGQLQPRTDDGEWRKTSDQGAEYFRAKWITAEKAKAGLQHAVVRPNVTGRAKKRITQCNRTCCSGSLATVD